MFDIQINDAPPLSIASISLSDNSGLPNHAPPTKVLKSTPFPSFTGFFTILGPVFIGAAAGVGAVFFNNERLPKNLISGVLFLGLSLSIAAAIGCDDDEGASWAGAGVGALGTPSASVSILNNGAPTTIYLNVLKIKTLKNYKEKEKR